MSAVKENLTSAVSAKELNQLVIDAISDVKGQDIVELGLKHLEEASTDYYIICHGDSHTQVKSIADNIIGQIKKKTGILPFHTEGQNNATWILVDYFDTVVHIFYHEAREFYQLENLWSDATLTKHEA